MHYQKLAICRLSVLIIVFNVLRVGKCYNLSPKPNIVIKDPGLFTHMPKYRSSYFGFTVNLRPSGIFVGAPRAQSHLESQRKINESGAIYKCSLGAMPGCRPYVFERRGNINMEHNDYSFNSEKRDYQWLGASMDGGIRDTDKLIVCAPRFVTPAVSEYLMNGICYWVNDTLQADPENIKKISPLRAIKQQIVHEGAKRYYYYMLAEQGLSAHVTPDNEEFLIGAPGISNWKGSVILHRKVMMRDNQSRNRRSAESRRRNLRQVDAMYSYESEIPHPRLFDLPEDSYFGYAVGSGYFDSNNPRRLMYVASAPQADYQSGEAFLFDIVNKKPNKHFVFRGLQFGEFFGYALLAEDVNGDGLTDVIVSAPMHGLGIGSYDAGAIYVYINQGRFNFERKLLTSPVPGNGRFGSSLTSLGDINRDGFNDVAVGAPYADGDGAVFVYLGCERGLREQYSQRLEYPINLPTFHGGGAMFGHGLSRGVDINNNGFNDLAIGAPNAEAVFFYQAYPVVSIKATITAESREIKQETTRLPVSICYSIQSSSKRFQSRELTLRVLLDAQVKRVRIASSGLNELKLNVMATKEMQCRVLDCKVAFKVNHIFKPIKLELHYKLVRGVPNSEVFCEDCAAVDPSEASSHSEKIIFSNGCGSDICVADMQVKSSLKKSFLVGSSATFDVTYEVTNMGETAYLPQINITSSNRMPFARIPPNCKLDEQVVTLLCDINYGQPMAKGVKEMLAITYDSSRVVGSNVTLTAKAFSTGKELNPANNFAVDVVELQERTAIDVVGVAKTDDIVLEKGLNSAEVVNVYQVKSNGPSSIDALEIALNIPVAYTIPDSHQTIPIVDMNNITVQAIYDEQSKDVEFFQNNTLIMMDDNDLLSVFSGSDEEIEKWFGDAEADFAQAAARRRRRRSALISRPDRRQYARIARTKSYELLDEDLKGTLPFNGTIVFSCNDREMTLCVRALVKIFDFRPNKPVSITLKYNVNLKEVSRILSRRREFFVIMVDVDLKKMNDPKSKTLTIKRKIDYNVVSRHRLYRVPIWYIILAIIGGILLLFLLSYLMYKVGFFKRAKKEEMKQLIHQAKVHRESMRINAKINGEG